MAIVFAMALGKRDKVGLAVVAKRQVVSAIDNYGQNLGPIGIDCWGMMGQDPTIVVLFSNWGVMVAWLFLPLGLDGCSVNLKLVGVNSTPNLDLEFVEIVRNPEVLYARLTSLPFRP